MTSSDAAVELGDTTSGTHQRGTDEARASRFAWLSRWGGLAAVLGAIIAFSIASPDTFATWRNAQSILTLAAIPLIFALGLTVVLVLGDFDLSVGPAMSLASGMVAVLMANQGVPWVAAVLITLVVTTAIGLANGVLVSFLGTSSLITTLAMGSALTGLQYLVTNQESVFQGIPQSLVTLGQGSTGPFKNTVWLALVLALVLGVVLSRTVLGRYMYATGGNEEAARVAGVPTSILRAAGFGVSGLFAGAAGVVLVAQAGSSYPDAGTPYLLPAYAAAFLGAAVLSRGQFTVGGTVLGVTFLVIIQNGLTILSLPTWVVNFFQGAVLLVAIVLTRLESRRA